MPAILFQLVNQRSGSLPVAVLAVIGLIVVSTCATKIIQVIYAQRAKIIAAKGKREVDALQQQSEAEIAKLRAVVQSVLLLSGEEEMIRLAVLNPDLPAGRRLSDDHILRALAHSEPGMSEPEISGHETRDTDQAAGDGGDPASVVRSLTQDGAA